MPATRNDWRVTPAARIGGEIRIPGDKSISHRALMCGALAEGDTRIRGFLAGEDCLSTLTALAALGVRIERPAPTEVRVHGVGLHGLRPAPAPLDMGNAGTAMRLLMGVLCGQDFPSTLVGDQSLSRRPMERVARPLRSMGATIDTTDGRPPVRLLGARRLHAIDYQLPVASAQLKSALLLAGLYAEGRMHLDEPAVTRDHTERMLAAFGVELIREPGQVWLEGGQPLRATEVEVPGDFSSAAFFIVAALLAAPQGLTLRNVGLNPSRTGLLDILVSMGADIRVSGRRDLGGEPVADLEVHQSALRGVRVPAALVPLAIDEFPVFFVAAACATGESLVQGAQELRVKETDRLAVMAEGLGRLGVRHELWPDGLYIEGGGLRGGIVDSHGDHRIAMAFAVAALGAREAVEVRDVQNVATSFPDFAQLASSIGLAVQAA